MSGCTPALLAEQIAAVRAHSLALAAPLSPEDQCVQSMSDASPAKWHLAHTTWFFETLVLQPHAPGYRLFDERFAFLFNSYYEALGPRHPRPQRGLLTRPSADEVRAYRAHVDAALAAFVPNAKAEVLALVELGLHHEQQHQELLLTDIQHLLSLNPLKPAYAEDAARPTPVTAPLRWLGVAGGRTDIGHAGAAFAFDNETPRHPVWLQDVEIASRPVTQGEYLAFIRDGGYADPQWWLSDGWAAVQSQGWQAPLYWQDLDAARPRVFTLAGLREIDADAPVAHLSLYEAAAYAAWAGARLPTEFEWEAAMARGLPIAGTGQVWEWTRSAYDPYPGFKPLSGAVAEYNGKFMVGQVVLRGGSVASPPGHVRPTYRNFFPPAARWQFSGLRLARDAR